MFKGAHDTRCYVCLDESTNSVSRIECPQCSAAVHLACLRGQATCPYGHTLVAMGAVEQLTMGDVVFCLAIALVAMVMGSTALSDQTLRQDQCFGTRHCTPPMENPLAPDSNMHWRGCWTPDVSYGARDVVHYDNLLFMCTRDEGCEQSRHRGEGWTLIGLKRHSGAPGARSYDPIPATFYSNMEELEWGGFWTPDVSSGAPVHQPT